MWFDKVMGICIALNSFCTSQTIVEDSAYWKQLSQIDLEQALKIVPNNGIAKNVLLFVGDGMGPTTVAAARIYGKTERGFLSFEKFPNMGSLKTYSADKYVPDSSSTATALFCGVKANYNTGGVDATVALRDCKASLNKSADLSSLVDWAQNAGKSTGFVTTTRVTHATPGSLYAYFADRKWECEDNKPPEAKDCEDIATQLVKKSPGKNIRVIMGGGRQMLQSNVNGSDADPISTTACYSKDGRDLIRDWKVDKENRGFSHAVVSNNQELENLDESTEFTLGIFANSHLKANFERDPGPKGMPSLTKMTEVAIKLLKKNQNGFFLMVEGGLIDLKHHTGHARQALDETVEFSSAIEKALELTADQAEETLVIVTSDHAHSLVFSGYGLRGGSILDVAQASEADQVGYTSLLYGTGGPNNYQYRSVNGTVVRPDPTNEDTRDFKYSQQAGVLTGDVTHSGTDVLVYSRGPMSHLFHGVHEQTYVTYVIGYSARMGPFENRTNLCPNFISGEVTVITLIVSVIYLFL